MNNISWAVSNVLLFMVVGILVTFRAVRGNHSAGGRRLPRTSFLLFALANFSWAVGWLFELYGQALAGTAFKVLGGGLFVANGAFALRWLIRNLRFGALLLIASSHQVAVAQSVPITHAPLIKIVLKYPGAPPTKVDQELCDPLERQIRGLEGARTITSISHEGGAEIYIQGAANANAAALLKGAEACRMLAMPLLPDGATAANGIDVSGQPVPLPAKIREVDYPFVNIDRGKALKCKVSIAAAFNAVEEAISAGKSLKDLTVEAAGGQRVPLGDFAAIKSVRGPDHVVRVCSPAKEAAAPLQDRSSRRH